MTASYRHHRPVALPAHHITVRTKRGNADRDALASKAKCSSTELYRSAALMAHETRFLVGADLSRATISNLHSFYMKVSLSSCIATASAMSSLVDSESGIYGRT